VEIRIVSLTPWATQLLLDLELDHWVAGCSHDSLVLQDPAQVPVVTRPWSSKEKEQLTLSEMFLSLWDVDMNKLRELAPSHLLTEGALNLSGLSLEEAEQILEQDGLPGCRLVDVYPHTLEELLHDMEAVGKLFGYEKKAFEKVRLCRKRLKKAARRSLMKKEVTVAILRNWPHLQLAGRWLSDLLRLVGAQPLIEGDDSFVFTDTYFERPPDVVITGDPHLSLEQNLQKAAALDKAYLSSVFQCEEPPRIVAVDGPVFYDHSCIGLENTLRILGEILHPENPDNEKKGVYWTPLKNLL